PSLPAALPVCSTRSSSVARRGAIRTVRCRSVHADAACQRPSSSQCPEGKRTLPWPSWARQACQARRRTLSATARGSSPDRNAGFFPGAAEGVVFACPILFDQLSPLLPVERTPDSGETPFALRGDVLPLVIRR